MIDSEQFLDLNYMISNDIASIASENRSEPPPDVEHLVL